MVTVRAFVVLGALGLALAPGCTCGSSGGRDTGPRRDVGPRDTGGGGGDEDTGGGGGDLDAWPPPGVDADLDAYLDPRLIDTALTDANSDVGPIDADEHDSGIGSIDGGARRDSGRVRDAGGDARVPAGACAIYWERGDQVPEECLPRCSRASRDLFDGCFGDAVCEATVTTRDITPYAEMWIWEEWEFGEVDCEGCVGTQRFSCWHDRCPSQAEAWQDCVSVRMAEACMREQGILERCLAPYRTDVDRCEDTRVAACFPPR